MDSFRVDFDEKSSSKTWAESEKWGKYLKITIFEDIFGHFEADNELEILPGRVL